MYFTTTGVNNGSRFSFVKKTVKIVKAQSLQLKRGNPCIYAGLLGCKEKNAVKIIAQNFFYYSTFIFIFIFY